MFKIGEFSKLSRVPVKTLRYYHEIYLRGPEPGVDPAEFVTEIQFPVAKA